MTLRLRSHEAACPECEEWDRLCDNCNGEGFVECQGEGCDCVASCEVCGTRDVRWADSDRESVWCSACCHVTSVLDPVEREARGVHTKISRPFDSYAPAQRLVAMAGGRS